MSYFNYNNFIFFSSAYYQAYTRINKLAKEYPINSSVTGYDYSITSIETFDKIEEYQIYIEGLDEFESAILEEWPTSLTSIDSYGNTITMPDIQRDADYNLTNTADLTYISEILEESLDYDKNNDFSLTRLIPQYYLKIDDSEKTFENFLNVLGESFDIDKKAIEKLSKQFHLNYSGDDKFDKGIEPLLGKLLGYNISEGKYNVDFNSYWTQQYFSLEQAEVSERLWNRILNNLVYLYKTKGTRESINSLINIYGIPENLIKIKEYAYALKPIDTKFNYSLSGETQEDYVNIKQAGKFIDHDKIKFIDTTEEDDLEYLRNVYSIPEIGIDITPIDAINEDIVRWMHVNGYNFSDIIGNPDPDAIDDTNYYVEMQLLADLYFLNYTENWTLQPIIDIIKTLDKGLYPNMKRLLPSRTKVISESMIIEPHLLERQKLTKVNKVQYEDLKKNTELGDLTIIGEHKSINVDEINRFSITSTNNALLSNSIELLETTGELKSVSGNVDNLNIISRTNENLYYKSTTAADSLLVDNMKNELTKQENYYDADKDIKYSIIEYIPEADDIIVTSDINRISLSSTSTSLPINIFTKTRRKEVLPFIELFIDMPLKETTGSGASGNILYLTYDDNNKNKYFISCTANDQYKTIVPVYSNYEGYTKVWINPNTNITTEEEGQIVIKDQFGDTKLTIPFTYTP